MKSSGSTYESSGSQFFRTTTGIQSRPDGFHESRFVMTFSPSWELQKYSFRLVLEGETDKEIT